MRLVDYRRLDAHPTAIISPEVSYYGDGVVTVGKGSRIDQGAMLTWDVSIGNYAHIAPYVVLYGKHGIEIGDYAGVAAFSVIFSESEDYSGRTICSPLVEGKYRGSEKGKVTVGMLANIGARCTVMPGVTLHQGSVLGAHSLAKSNCLEWGIYAGTPAQWIKSRDRHCRGMVYEREGYEVAA